MLSVRWSLKEQAFSRQESYREWGEVKHDSGPGDLEKELETDTEGKFPACNLVRHKDYLYINSTKQKYTTLFISRLTAIP